MNKMTKITCIEKDQEIEFIRCNRRITLISTDTTTTKTTIIALTLIRQKTDVLSIKKPNRLIFIFLLISQIKF